MRWSHRWVSLRLKWLSVLIATRGSLRIVARAVILSRTLCAACTAASLHMDETQIQVCVCVCVCVLCVCAGGLYV